MRVPAWPLRWPGRGHARRLAGLSLAGFVLLQVAASAQPASAQPVSAAGNQPASAGTAGTPAGHRTVVSFTFDDGDADQMTAARILRAYRMPATFYVITGAVGTPNYLTLADLRQLARAGNEIGGHTVSHLDLTHLSAAEARRQICQGRDVLTRWGFRVTSFAYPGAAYDRAAQAIARECGFTGARIATGLRSPGCPGCAAAETIPPARPYAIRTPGQVDTSWTLADLQRVVVTAERSGGGWVPFIFHHVCTTGSCGQLSIKASTLNAFAAWLAQRQRSTGTVVKTVAGVMGGTVRPPVPVRPAAAHGVRNPSLESVTRSSAIDLATESAGRPGTFLTCWMEGGYGDNTARWQRTQDAHSGRWAQQLTMSHFHSGGAQLLPTFDLGACSLPVTAGRSYQLGTWYTSTARTQFTVYYRDGTGRWRYWASSPYFQAAGQWTQAQWQTPPVPAGATGLSFGLSLFSNGTLTTDDYSFAVPPPDSTRRIVDWALLGVLALIGMTVVVRRTRVARLLTRGPRAGPPPGAGSAPRTTRPPAGSGRRVS
ncbi:MAG TPA: polysaccharide deacetylase family protein [Streptosporangiaceae bacterium]|nr:polysaccharide deacetylase family protein [Streptosporangiaceae bacterium]